MANSCEFYFCKCAVCHWKTVPLQKINFIPAFFPRKCLYLPCWYECIDTTYLAHFRLFCWRELGHFTKSKNRIWEERSFCLYSSSSDIHSCGVFLLLILLTGSPSPTSRMRKKWRLHFFNAYFYLFLVPFWAWWYENYNIAVRGAPFDFPFCAYYGTKFLKLTLNGYDE
mgnify:CR=1 FL=1